MSNYKQTAMGLLPQSWNVSSVMDLVAEHVIEKPMDGNHGNIHPKSSDYVSDGIPFVMANNFRDGQIDTENCKFIKRAQADKLQKGFAITGDVLLTHKGTVGSTAVVGPLATDYIMLTPQVTFYRVKNPDRLSNSYLRHYFDSDPFQALFTSLAGGGTRAYLGISRQLALPIIVPPIVEQLAIAEALSDIDALLSGLDRLIAKKRDIKQAAMQQLLIGKTRLPGFSGDWEVKRLGDLLLEIGDGGTPSTANRSNFGGSISWVVIDDIRDEIWATKETLSDQGLRACAARLWPVGTLILSTGATIGEVGIAKVPVATKQGICGLIFNSNLADSNFMKYWFQQNKQQLLSKAQGSSIKEVRAPTLAQFALSTPSVAEQIAVATVLSYLDSELVALEARRDKTRMLKQGMMQELLTGKTRLVCQP